MWRAGTSHGLPVVASSSHLRGQWLRLARASCLGGKGRRGIRQGRFNRVGGGGYRVRCSPHCRASNDGGRWGDKWGLSASRPGAPCRSP